MAWGDKTLNELERKILNNANQAGSLIALVAADEFAPKGATGALSESIVAGKAKKRGNSISIVITASAKSAQGYDYAAIQHDKELMHIQVQPVGAASFTDMGQGSTRRQRYQSGLNRFYTRRRGQITSKNAPVYASKFIELAVEKTKEQVKRILNKAGVNL